VLEVGLLSLLSFGSCYIKMVTRCDVSLDVLLAGGIPILLCLLYYFIYLFLLLLMVFLLQYLFI